MSKGILGVVLAGGLSSRFGRDKALAVYRGRPLIEWSIESLEDFADAIIISGRSHGACPGVPDRPEGGLGPLGGMAGALAAASERGYDRLLSLPCDTPHVPRDLLEALCASREAACLAECPVIGIWPSALAPVLESRLRNGGDRSIRSWARDIGARPVGAGRNIANVNRAEDLDRLGADEPKADDDHHS